MPSISNLKIIYKVGLIVALLALVTAGAIGFAATRMGAISDAYSDLVTRVDGAVMKTVRANRRAEAFMSTGFQLLTEKSADSGAMLLGDNVEHRAEYETLMAEALKAIPEQDSLIKPVVAKAHQAFVACDAPISFAAAATSVQDNLRAADELRKDCKPRMLEAIAAQGKLADGLIAYAGVRAGELGDLTRTTIVLSVVAAAVGLLAGLAIAMLIGIKGLSQPIARLKVVMEAFAGNDLAHDVPGITRRDELGDMARTVEVFKTNGLEVARMRTEQQAGEHHATQQRRADMQKLASDFEGAVGAIIQTVSSAATQLEASANTLTATAGRTEQLSTVVASAAEEASTNVQSVASASEEMASSVDEISRQVQESARIASDAVAQAEATNARVGELSESAKKIGDVVKLISTIAEQTNLLALNATIEAARAGEAGRGFAVVASEVKALAAQTSKATGEIGSQIAAIQAATEGSVVAIRAIGATIGRISEISSTIAAAVEEQGAATREISRNVQQAAQGTTGVASNIADVQRGSTETGSASSQVLSSAQSLSVESHRLQSEVSSFLATVRAA